MRTIASAIREIVLENPILLFGVRHRLLNFSKASTYIQSLVEAKTKKNVSTSALTMALSRLGTEIGKDEVQRECYTIDRVTMQSKLSTWTFRKSPDVLMGVHRLYERVQKSGGYITISTGTIQVTVICESRFCDDVRSVIANDPEFSCDRVAAVGVAFSERYLEVPGLIYIVLQQMMLLNINIIEVSSTYTELTLYVSEEDLKVAFEALETLFVTK